MKEQTDKIGWLISDTFRGTAEISSEQFGLLVDHAESYLRAVGQITPSEWRCLSTVERKAFEEAGRRIDDGRTEKMANILADKITAKLFEKLPEIVAARFEEKA